MSTLVPLWATAVKTRAATPGTPCMPRPCTVMMLRSRIAVMPLITVPLVILPVISVPGWSGFRELSTRRGIFGSTSG